MSKTDVPKQANSDSAAILEKTFSENYNAFLRKSSAMLRSFIDAEDAVQNTFMKAWRYQSGLRDAASCHSWLNRILYHECLAVSKERAKHTPVLYDGQIDQVPTLHADAEAQFERWFVETILSSLPERYRLPLLLFYKEGFSVNEIAEMLHLEPKLIRHRIAYARTLVKKLYLEHTGDE